MNLPVCRSLRQRPFALLIAFVIVVLPARHAFGDTIFVVNRGSGDSDGTIGEYVLSGTTVTTVNKSLVNGLAQPMSIAVSGSNLFVLNSGAGTIDEYTTSGAVVKKSLITGLTGARGLAVSGSDLFVTDAINGRIKKFTTAGQLVNANLITGLTTPQEIAVFGSSLFVTDWTEARVGMYTTSGGILNPDLISYPDLENPVGVSLAVSGSELFVSNVNLGTIGKFGLLHDSSTGKYSTEIVDVSLIENLGNPWGIAVSGSNLFVCNAGAGTIAEYTTAGAMVKDPLIRRLNSPMQMVIVPAASSSVPDEGATFVLLGAGLSTLVMARSFRRRPRANG
ncbi:MAG: hypothetical protein NTV51_06595 [Verrucomicrobia bacterium]|nr:hypothetical protein [Verrucomicrobiota bacterium]